MAATTTKLGIVNRALQLLGSQSIGSLTENSKGAKSMSRAYDAVLLAELRSNTWNFSIKRANLVADTAAPLFGTKHIYPLPGDYLFLAPEETTMSNPRPRDWQIEGQTILSKDASPLPIRFVSSALNESIFDVLFAEALSHSLAINTCEEITNSNTKKQDIGAAYLEVIGRAKRRNAIENPPIKAPTCSWITVRS